MPEPFSSVSTRAMRSMRLLRIAVSSTGSSMFQASESAAVPTSSFGSSRPRTTRPQVSTGPTISSSPLDFFPPWGHSSVGRASRWQREGHGFESRWLHHSLVRSPGIAFALAGLEGSPRRVLEIGCGEGELATALAAAGHEVVAIDPEAPTGAIFRRVSLEEFESSARFDAVVASLSLHHIPDLEAAADKVAGMLVPEGCFLV